MTRRRAFTLIEILVVIGIIVVLLGILIPVVGKVQRSSRVAAVQAQLNGLAGAIERYNQDHRAYPGPLFDDDLKRTGFTGLTNVTPVPAGYAYNMAPPNSYQITGTENLVLGLLGGLVLQGTATSVPPVIAFDPTAVGKGPANLTFAKPMRYSPYAEATNLSWRTDDATGLKTGKFKDGAGEALDSIIPEFVDTFSSPMPILYLRARKGFPAPAGPASAYTDKVNPVITDVPAPGAQVRGHYDLSQILGYTGPGVGGAFIGEGKRIKASDYKPTAAANPSQLPHGLATVDPAKVMDSSAPTYQFPYDAYPYLKDPSSPADTAQPRQKDGFILISAGDDRVYGTADDIASFGSVNP